MIAKKKKNTWWVVFLSPSVEAFSYDNNAVCYDVNTVIAEVVLLGGAVPQNENAPEGQ